MSRRLLKALERAHFKAICAEMERETLTYYYEDNAMDPLWSFHAMLEKMEPAGGWVN